MKIPESIFRQIPESILRQIPMLIGEIVKKFEATLEKERNSKREYPAVFLRSFIYT